MDSQSADGTILNDTININFLRCRGVEWGAIVAEFEGDSLFIGKDLKKDVGTGTLGVGVVHHIDHRLLDSEINASGGKFVEAHIFADTSDKDGQSRHLLYVVDQRDSSVIMGLALTALVLDGEQ